MKNAVILTSPIALAILGAIIVIHIISALPKISNGRSRVPLIILGALNVLLHIGLIAISVVSDAPAEELFAAIMVSCAVGLVSIGVEEKRRKRQASLDVEE